MFSCDLDAPAIHSLFNVLYMPNGGQFSNEYWLLIWFWECNNSWPKKYNIAILVYLKNVNNNRYCTSCFLQTPLCVYASRTDLTIFSTVDNYKFIKFIGNIYATNIPCGTVTRCTGSIFIFRTIFVHHLALPRPIC